MLNKVILIGNICNDIEAKKTSNDVDVCTFTLAVKRKYSKSNDENATDFIKVVAWRNNVLFLAKYFSKGDPVCVEGSLQTRRWEKDGTTHWATEVMVENVSFVGAKKQQEQPNNGLPEGFTPIEEDDFLPF